MVAIEHRQQSSTAATATTLAAATETAASPSANIGIDGLSPTSPASSSVSAVSNTTRTTISSIQQQLEEQEQEQVQVVSEEEEEENKEKEKENEQPDEQKQKTLEEKKQLVEEVLKTNPKALKQLNNNKKSDIKMSQLDTPAEIDKSTTEQQKQSKTGGGAVSKSAVSQRNVEIKTVKKSNNNDAKELTKKIGLKLDLTAKDLNDSIKSPKSPIARLPHQTSLTSSVDVEDRKTLREALYQGIFHRHRRTIFAVGSFLRMLRSRNSQYNTIRSSSEGEEVEEVR